MKPSDYGIVQSLDYEFVDFDWYEYPENIEDWATCPFCGQKPKVLEFDNGRQTACGCLLQEYSLYNHFSIKAEPIMSVYRRTGKTAEYNSDDLRKNWNRWCLTGEINYK